LTKWFWRERGDRRGGTWSTTTGKPSRLTGPPCESRPGNFARAREDSICHRIDQEESSRKGEEWKGTKEDRSSKGFPGEQGRAVRGEKGSQSGGGKKGNRKEPAKKRRTSNVLARKNASGRKARRISIRRRFVKGRTLKRDKWMGRGRIDDGSSEIALGPPGAASEKV